MNLAGVLSLSLEGESRDRVVVTGDGVDAVQLTNKLRKKFHYATLISVEDMEEDEEEEEDEEDEEEEEEEEEEATPQQNSPRSHLPPFQIWTTYLQGCPLCNSFVPPSPMHSHVVYDSDHNSCTIV